MANTLLSSRRTKKWQEEGDENVFCAEEAPAPEGRGTRWTSSSPLADLAVMWSQSQQPDQVRTRRESK